MSRNRRKSTEGRTGESDAAPGNADTPPPDHLIERFLHNQSAELQLRAKELELQRQSDQDSYAYAKEALKAQAEDRKNVIAHMDRTRRDLLIFAGMIGLLMVGVIGFAIYNDAKEIAQLIIQALVFAGAGGGGGYYLGYSRGQQKHQAGQARVEEE